MTADLLAIEWSARDSLPTALLAFAAAAVFLICAVATFPYGEKAWYKSKWLLATIGFLGLAGGLITGGVLCLQDSKALPPPDESHAGIVQDWAETTYEVTVSKDQAEGMVKAIRNVSKRVGETFIVSGASGIIEVKLLETEDGTFHLVQSAAELPLAEARK